MSGATSVPSNCIQTVSNRPNLVEVSTDNSVNPLIDLQGLNGPNRFDVVKEIGRACQTYGFFQVTNHGIPKEVIDKMLCVSNEFFHLPKSEGMKHYFSDESWDPKKSKRLSSTSSFARAGKSVTGWRDFLMLKCDHLIDNIHKWPTNPQSFREDVAEYCRSARELTIRLLEAISESLGLEKGYMINQAFDKHSLHMLINYYPACPRPKLTVGLPSHSDANVITTLPQDDVSGLQMLKDGKWVAVNPISDTFIIILGDQMQVLRNDRYKRVLYRVVNSEKERISTPFLYAPSPDTVIGPAPHLIDDGHPAVYRNYTWTEYHKKYMNLGSASDTCLDMFKLETSAP